MNFHPLEKQVLVADATMTLVMLCVAILLESTVLLMIAIAVITLPCLYLQQVLPDRLGSWHRYTCGVKSAGSASEGDARKNGARPPL
jgi:hypothetical protein